MADVVNLRIARKRVRRKQQAHRAAEQRLVHGQTKASRTLKAARLAKALHELELHRLDEDKS